MPSLVRIRRALKELALIIDSIGRFSRNKVGEALQLFMSILNSSGSLVTRHPPDDTVQKIGTESSREYNP